MPSPAEPPFITRMRDIAEGTRQMPETEARRHHYVPSFLLARWATPQKRSGTFFELLVASGEVNPSKPDKTAWERDLYAVDRQASSPDLVIEAFLSIIEENAAGPIKNLATLPTDISDHDRATIAFFLALQQGRTPPGLAQQRKIARMAAEQSLHKFFGDRQALSAHYRRTVNPDATEREIETFAIKEIKAFKRGERTIDLPPESAFKAMLTSVSAIAAGVAAMHWTLVENAAAEFITNDRGLAMWDPSLPASRGHAWESSPQAEATVPVAPNVCLRLTPGAQAFDLETVTAETVAEYNLRTYGWADKSIFGTERHIVEAVHNSAQATPANVTTPRVPPDKARSPQKEASSGAQRDA